jgi:DNA-3-methyladenine glycosylase I
MAVVKTSRCAWCGEDPQYVDYHDQEWGVPVRETKVLFERLVLEGMQAGLSWLTVLRKRAHMRKCFCDFEPAAIDREGPGRIESWLADPGLIRHRGKLESVIDNARACLAMGDRFGSYLWDFVDGRPVQNRWRSLAEVPATTPQSEAMSKALRKAGFRFVGPTTCYAFMQSAGFVNDHLVSCDRHGACRSLGAAWSG